MARVSIDDASSTGSSKSAAPKKRSGGSPAKSSGGGMDTKQKIKAAAATAVILVAGVFILYQTNVIGGVPAPDPTAPPDATPEAIEAFNRAQEEQHRSSGNTRTAPPMPLGSN